MASETLFIGYLPKQFTEAAGDIHTPAYSGVEEICSVSECIAISPPDWVDKWAHNTDTWLFDTPEAAWSVVPAGEQERYRLYAYRLLPTLFHESGQETEHPLPELMAVPMPDGFSCLGYDAVVRHVGTTHDGGNETPAFLCSPLSCNGMAEEYTVNRYCLVDDLDTAIAMARDFASGNCEPGAYCVVEVWRQEPCRGGAVQPAPGVVSSRR